MTPAVLALVLTAAVLHAAWNLLAKRAQAADTVAFVWLTTAVSAAIYLPFVAVWLTVRSVASAAHRDRSRVHRRHRGDPRGIFLAAAARLSRGRSVAGVPARARHRTAARVDRRGAVPRRAPRRARRHRHRGDRRGDLRCARVRGCTSHARALSLGYGLATGATIAAYTLWDKHAVSALAIAPVVYEVGHYLRADGARWRRSSRAVNAAPRWGRCGERTARRSSASRRCHRSATSSCCSRSSSRR